MGSRGDASINKTFLEPLKFFPQFQTTAMDWKQYKQDRYNRFVQGIKIAEQNIANFQAQLDHEEDPIKKQVLQQEIAILEATRSDLIGIVQRLKSTM